MHGAKPSSAVKRGADHGRYRTGQHTQAAKAAYRAEVKKLMQIEGIGFKAGWMTGERTRGRKQK